jgi:hypothetical protein
VPRAGERPCGASFHGRWASWGSSASRRAGAEAACDSGSPSAPGEERGSPSLELHPAPGDGRVTPAGATRCRGPSAGRRDAREAATERFGLQAEQQAMIGATASERMTGGVAQPRAAAGPAAPSSRSTLTKREPPYSTTAAPMATGPAAAARSARPARPGRSPSASPKAAMPSPVRSHAAPVRSLASSVRSRARRWRGSSSPSFEMIARSSTGSAPAVREASRSPRGPGGSDPAGEGEAGARLRRPRTACRFPS